MFLAWIAILALVMRFGGGAPAALVLFPPDDFLARLDRSVSVTGASAMSFTLRSATPDVAARAYAAGAPLVLPAGLEACIPAFLREPAPDRAK